jgi:hypothetical protein
MEKTAQTEAIGLIIDEDQEAKYMRNAFQRCAARIVVIIPFAASLGSPSLALAAPILGSAQSFAVRSREPYTKLMRSRTTRRLTSTLRTIRSPCCHSLPT